MMKHEEMIELLDRVESSSSEETKPIVLKLREELESRHRKIGELVLNVDKMRQLHEKMGETIQGYVKHVQSQCEHRWRAKRFGPHAPIESLSCARCGFTTKNEGAIQWYQGVEQGRFSVFPKGVPMSGLVISQHHFTRATTNG